MDEKLDMNKLCSECRNLIMGCLRKSVASRPSEVILPLYFALLTLHPERCVQLWSPQNKKDMDVLEHLQRGPQR